MISRWFYNLYKGNAVNANLFDSFLLIFGAVAAGYTIFDWPYHVSNLFAHPIGQFIVFSSLGLSAYYMNPESNYPIIYVFIDSLIYTILFQIIKNAANPLNGYLKKHTYVEKALIDDVIQKKMEDGILLSGVLKSSEYTPKYRWDKGILIVWSEKDRVDLSPIENHRFTLFVPNPANSTT